MEFHALLPTHKKKTQNNEEMCISFLLRNAEVEQYYVFPKFYSVMRFLKYTYFKLR
jgi:hypothetical protein